MADAADGKALMQLNAGQSYPEARLTPYVVMSCVMAASGGLMYGYDLVIAGGIAVMDDFLAKFYPEVLVEKRSAKHDNYCKYNNVTFQLFASCLYISALLATFIASTVTRRYGRIRSMQVAGLLFILGTVIGTAAQNLATLFAGRTLLGCGLGFSNQAVPLYLSEIAPPRLRGALHYMFVINASFGGLSATVVNYLADQISPWGWRLSLGIAGIPAILLTVSSMLLAESPVSLIQRGYYDEARKVLAKIRGSENIDAEFEDLLEVSSKDHDMSTKAQLHAFKSLLQRRHIPHVVMGLAFPFFQQVGGNDAILFYGAFLFKTAGFSDEAALYSGAITGAIGFLTVCISSIIVDRFGRKKLLFTGTTLMLSAMITIALIFATSLTANTQKLPRIEGVMQVLATCVFVFAFSGSLGPLAWLIPSEVYPLEVRSAGMSMTVCVNMLFKFLIAQTFLTMLCAMKYGIFLFFGGCLVVMAIFVALFLPETKGIPLDAMQEVWAKHWFWKRVVPPLKQSAMQRGDGQMTAV